MSVFAVIDTETNWANQVMSIGIAFGLSDNFECVGKAYYLITPACAADGLYSDVLFLEDVEITLIGTKNDVIQDILKKFKEYEVEKIFAYCAGFDLSHLMELKDYPWYDIMVVAANKNYNKKINDYMECFANGRLKKGGSVQAIYRLLSGEYNYYEVHNGLKDAIDELDIMGMLGVPIDDYPLMVMKEKTKKKNSVKPCIDDSDQEEE